VIGVGANLIGIGEDATSMLAGALGDATTQLGDVFTGTPNTSKYGFVPQT
jgi:hypothetical protein